MKNIEILTLIVTFVVVIALFAPVIINSVQDETGENYVYDFAKSNSSKENVVIYNNYTHNGTSNVIKIVINNTINGSVHMYYNSSLVDTFEHGFENQTRNKEVKEHKINTKYVFFDGEVVVDQNVKIERDSIDDVFGEFVIALLFIFVLIVLGVIVMKVIG